MNGPEQTAEFIYLIAILIFVASAFMIRRVPIGKGLQMFAAWVVIFLAAFVAFALTENRLRQGLEVLRELGHELDMRSATPQPAGAPEVATQKVAA